MSRFVYTFIIGCETKQYHAFDLMFQIHTHQLWAVIGTLLSFQDNENTGVDKDAACNDDDEVPPRAEED